MALCCVSIGTLLQTQIALRLEVCFLLFCWPVYQKMKIEGVVEVNEWEISAFGSCKLLLRLMWVDDSWQGGYLMMLEV